MIITDLKLEPSCFMHAVAINFYGLVVLALVGSFLICWFIFGWLLVLVCEDGGQRKQCLQPLLDVAHRRAPKKNPMSVLHLPT